MLLRAVPLIACLLPAAAWALPAAPPLTVPPDFGTPLGPIELDAPPLETPVVAAPPVDLELPDLPVVDFPEAGEGPPGSLSVIEVEIPDLRGQVDLPGEAAALVIDKAPPFGGPIPGRPVAKHVVPEPGTALLLAAGLVALGARRSSPSRESR